MLRAVQSKRKLFTNSKEQKENSTPDGQLDKEAHRSNHQKSSHLSPNRASVHSINTTDALDTQTIQLGARNSSPTIPKDSTKAIYSAETKNTSETTTGKLYINSTREHHSKSKSNPNGSCANQTVEQFIPSIVISTCSSSTASNSTCNNNNCSIKKCSSSNCNSIISEGSGCTSSTSVSPNLHHNSLGGSETDTCSDKEVHTFVSGHNTFSQKSEHNSGSQQPGLNICSKQSITNTGSKYSLFNTESKQSLPTSGSKPPSLLSTSSKQCLSNTGSKHSLSSSGSTQSLHNAGSKPYLANTGARQSGLSTQSVSVSSSQHGRGALCLASSPSGRGLAPPPSHRHPAMPMSERQQIALLMQMSSPPPNKCSSSSSSSSNITSPRCNSPYNNSNSCQHNPLGTPPSRGVGTNHNSSFSTPPHANTTMGGRGIGVKRNERGETPLHVAAIRGDADRVHHLIARGADVNAVDYAGWTALHEACNRGFVSVARELISSGAAVNAEGLDNDTPLHDACVNNHFKLVELLLGSGASTEVVNRRGQTPADVCRSPFILSLLHQAANPTTTDTESSKKSSNGTNSGKSLKMSRRTPPNKLDKLDSKQVESSKPGDKSEEQNSSGTSVAQCSTSATTASTASGGGGGSPGSNSSAPQPPSQNVAVAAGVVGAPGVGLSTPQPTGAGGPVSPRATMRMPAATAPVRTPEKITARSSADSSCITGGSGGRDDPYEFRCTKDDSLSQSPRETDASGGGAGQASHSPNGGKDAAVASTPVGVERGEKRSVDEVEEEEEEEDDDDDDEDEEDEDEDDDGEQAKKRRRKEEPKEEGPVGGITGKGFTRAKPGDKTNKPARSSMLGSSMLGSSNQLQQYNFGGNKCSSNNNSDNNCSSNTSFTSGCNNKTSSCGGSNSCTTTTNTSTNTAVSGAGNNSNNTSGSSGGGSVVGGNVGSTTGGLINIVGMECNRKSPHSVPAVTAAACSPKMLLKQEEASDDDLAGRLECSAGGLSGGAAGGPKVPPLKIVLSSCGGGAGGGSGTSAQEQEQSGVQTGKNTSARHLPYVVSANQGDKDDLQPTTTASSSASMAASSAVPPAVNNATGEQRDAIISNVKEEPLSPGGGGGSGLASTGYMGVGEKSAPRITRSQRGTGSNSADEAGSTVEVKVKTEECVLNSSSSTSTTSASCSGGGGAGTSSFSTAADNLLPRKRKLTPSKDEEPDSPPPHTEQPIANCYQMFLKIRKQIDDRRKLLFPVQPKPPQGFKDYLMNRGTYVLAGNPSSQHSFPTVAPPQSLQQTLKDLFSTQEQDRYKLRLQHQIEREKLVLSVEQEILRVHGRAARALANQVLPFSACTVLRDQEVYNILTPEQEEKHRNARSRYNGRLFISWLQDVDDKWEKIKESMVLRQQNEAESLHAVHRMDWEWKLKELGLCDNKSRPVIEELHVPMVAVSDFDLLPA